MIPCFTILIETSKLFNSVCNVICLSLGGGSPWCSCGPQATIDYIYIRGRGVLTQVNLQFNFLEFYHNNPSLWFMQLELIFTVRKVKHARDHPHPDG